MIRGPADEQTNQADIGPGEHADDREYCGARTGLSMSDYPLQLEKITSYRFILDQKLENV